MPFGGSCLPKDLRALNHRAQPDRPRCTPLLNAVLPSNRALSGALYRHRAGDRRPKRVAVLGMSFKADTDDLRESPMLTLIEALIGKGKTLAIYDSNVSLSQLTGANHDYLENTIPHVASLLKPSIAAALADAELLLVGYNSPEFQALPKLKREGQRLIDFSTALKPEYFADAEQAASGPALQLAAQA